MVPQHAKSPCCSALIYRYGPRRRQCRSCKVTWTVRPRKRGRPTKRLSQELIRKVFLERYTLRHLGRRRPHLSQITFRHHFRQLLRAFLAQPRSLKVQDGPLVLLLDGLWFRFGRTPWVLYQIALKPASGTTAIFLDPILLQGKESAANWERALAVIPDDFRKRIVAVVVDNLGGMEQSAQRHGWVLQLCQFHMLLKFQARRGMLTHSLRGGDSRVELYHLIKKALVLPQGRPLDDVLLRLKSLASHPALPRRIRGSALEFLACLNHYRAHLNHPALGIPSTTNSVESMGALIRDLFKRHRSATTPKSVILWATTMTRIRPEIVCNGGFSTE